MVVIMPEYDGFRMAGPARFLAQHLPGCLYATRVDRRIPGDRRLILSSGLGADPAQGLLGLCGKSRILIEWLFQDFLIAGFGFSHSAQLREFGAEFCILLG